MIFILIILTIILKETIQFCDNQYTSTCKYLTALSVDSSSVSSGTNFNFNAVDLNNILERSNWNGEQIQIYFSSQFYLMRFYNTNNGGSAGDSYAYVDDPSYTFTNFQTGNQIYFDNIPETCIGNNRQATISGQCECEPDFINIQGNDCEKCLMEECSVCEGQSQSNLSPISLTSLPGFQKQSQIQIGFIIPIKVVNFYYYICMGIVKDTQTSPSFANTASFCSDYTIRNNYGTQSYSGELQTGTYNGRTFYLLFDGQNFIVREKGSDKQITMNVDQNETYHYFIHGYDTTSSVIVGEEPIQKCTDCIGTESQVFSRNQYFCICPDGYYSDIANNNLECQQCAFNTCLKCDNGTECSVCQGVLGKEQSRGINSVTGKNECVCPENYASDLPNSFACIPDSCLDTCLSCESLTECTVCKGTLNEVFSRVKNPANNKMECICPDNYYSLLPTQEDCEQCGFEGCKTCENKTACLTCLGNENQIYSRIVNPSTGINECICPVGYYSYIAGSQNCYKCLDGCIDCVDGTECLNCRGTLGQVYSRLEDVNGKKTCVCPDGYYSIAPPDNDCLLCSDNFEGCAKCTNATACTLCKGDQNQTYSRVVNPTNNVLECICPINHFSKLPAEENCAQCPFEGCESCTENACLTCLGIQDADNSRIANDSGVLSCICPQGYYSDLTVSNNCLKCLEGCIECVNGTECTGDCKGTLNEVFSRGVNFVTSKYDCTCPRGYYSIISSGTSDDCQLCTDNFEGCDTCTNETECTLCIGAQSQDQSRIVNPVTSKNECICPFNYYSDISIQDDCIQCKFEGCKTCNDQIQCLECFGTAGAPSSRIVGPDENVKQCICPINYYSDLTISQNCVKCKFSACFSCENQVECLTCKGTQGEVFTRTQSSPDLNDCICPDGYYSDIETQDDCIICPYETCATCQNGIECLVCIGVQGQEKSRRQDPDNSINECVCPYNYYSDIENFGADCIQCAFKSCKHCSDQIECTICVGDTDQPYSRIPNEETGLNECICPINYYSDLNIQDNCIKCLNDACYSCENTIECLVCKGDQNQPHSRIINPDNNINECICPIGYYSVIPDGDNCLLCIDNFEGCQQCENATECTVCIGETGQSHSRIINPDNGKNECICPNKFYSDVSLQEDCLACSFDTCLQCINDQECTVCIGDQGQPHSRIPNPDTSLLECICPSKHFSDLTIQDSCMQCEFQCAECETNASTCTQCIGIRDLEIGCHCHRGFYDNRVDIECLPCESGCAHCNLNQCIECIANKYNHNPGTDKTCDCLGPNYLDHSGITEYCTNCDTMIIKKIQFSNDFLSLIITFYDQVVFRNTIYNVQTFTKEFCVDLFELDTQLAVGKGSLCALDSTNKIITVKFGTNPTVIQQDTINFKQNFLQRLVCLETEFINDFHESYVLQAENPVQPIAEFTKLGDRISVCDNIQINNSKIANDGNRGLFNVTWTLEYSTSGDTIEIEQILQQSNLNKQNYLIIPPLVLKTQQQYQFKVSYENIGFQKDSKIFEFSTLEFRKGISAQVIQTRPFVFRNFQQNEVESVVSYLDCAGGEFTQVPKSLNVTWYDEEDEDNPKFIDSIITEPDQQIATYKMQKYSQIPGKVYNFKARIKSVDEDIEQNVFFLYEIIQTNLIAMVEGGNRLQSYSKEMNILGKGYDPDIKPELQELNIQHSWGCFDMGRSIPCETIIGDQLVFNQTNTVYFKPRLFNPYSSLQFTYNIVKENREPSLDKIVIVIIEDELPELDVTVPEAFQTQKINLNDDIQITIHTDNDPDEVFFSIVILYDLEIVATKSFNYNVMAFKLWDIYSDFSTSDNNVLIRVSMYNPQFFMPSQSNFNIQINFEPQDGQLIITPLSGIALDTNFNILLDGFKDENLPLSYKYYYYLQESDYYTDLQNGENTVESLKNILVDYTNVNQITTKLPQGNLFIDDDQNELFQVLIMVSVSDSLGAIKNVTQTIEVNPNPKNFNSQLSQFENDLKKINQQQIDSQISYLNLLTAEISDLGVPNCENNCSGDGECIQEESIKECQCNEGFYLKDCSQSQGLDKYQKIIKQLYDLLQKYSEIVSSQAIKDQIQKSINIISNNKELNDIIESEDLEKNIKIQNKVVKEQKSILKSIFDSGLLFQGNNIISNKFKQVREILGKGYKNVNSSFKNIKSLKKRRKLTEGESLNMQEQIIQISTNTTEQLQEALIPNGNPIEYQGSDVRLKAQKLTYKQLYSQFFETSEIFIEQDFNDPTLNQNDSDGEQTDGEITDGELDGEFQEENIQSKIFTTSQNNYKNNPYLSEAEFPYPNQDLGLIDVVLKTVEQSKEDETFDLTQPLNVRFEAIANATNIKCITRSQSTREWKNEYCQPSEKEGSNGQPQINCSCKNLVPVTVIDDINNLFEDSLVSSVFSDDGLAALENFKFWESYMFYVILFKTLFLIGAMIHGYQLDNPKPKKIKVEQYEQQKQITQTDIKSDGQLLSPTSSKQTNRIFILKENQQGVIQKEDESTGKSKDQNDIKLNFGEYQDSQDNSQNSSQQKNVKRTRKSQFNRNNLQQQFFERQKKQEEKEKEEQELEQQKKFKEEQEFLEQEKLKKRIINKKKQEIMKKLKEKQGKFEKLPKEKLQKINELYSEKGMDSLQVVDLENTNKQNSPNNNKFENTLCIDPILEDEQEESMEQSSKQQQQQIINFTESSDSAVGNSKLQYSSELENSNQIEKSFQQIQQNAQDINIPDNLDLSPNSSKNTEKIQENNQSPNNQNNLIIINDKSIPKNDQLIDNKNDIKDDTANKPENVQNINNLESKNDLENNNDLISKTELESKNDLINKNEINSKNDEISKDGGETQSNQNSNHSDNKYQIDTKSKISDSIAFNSPILTFSQDQQTYLKNEQSYQDSTQQQGLNTPQKKEEMVKSKRRKSLAVVQQRPKPKKFSFIATKKKEIEPEVPLTDFNLKILQEIKKKEIQEQIDKSPTFKKPIKEHKLRHVSEGIIQFHEFFSIFYIKDEKISRPVRFAIYYLKITLLIAISGLFSQNTTFVQGIVLSIFTSILIIIPMNLIIAMYKSPKKPIKIMAVSLLISLQLLIIYTILVTAAVMGVEKSNEWVQSYGYTFITNFFIIVPLEIAIVLNVIKYGILKGKKNILIDEKNQTHMIKFLYPDYK